MFKSLIAAAALTLALSSAALAEDMMCDDASIMKAEEMAKGMTDPAMKDKMEMAMKEVDMAKMSMKENKMDDCKMHIGEAMKATAK
jgi:hypothetical protein